MAGTGTRKQAIAFGDYEINVALVKANGSRDVKTEYVNAAGAKVTGGGGGGRPPGAQKAVRLSEDQVVRLPADELNAIEETSKKTWGTMRVLETIDYRQVPTERIVAGYWLQPDRGSAKGLALLAHGLKGTGRVAVVKWCGNAAHGREKLGIIRVRHVLANPNRAFHEAATPEQKIALLLSELSFANDFMRPDDDVLAINDVELAPESIGAAERLVKAFARKGGEHAIDTASDEAVDQRLALVERLSGASEEERLARAAELGNVDAETGEVFA